MAECCGTELPVCAEAPDRGLSRNSKLKEEQRGKDFFTLRLLPLPIAHTARAIPAQIQAGKVIYMERYAWKATVKDGMLDEYIRRHNEIWPELKQVLKDAGICNYTIWNVGNELFGYYECEQGVDFAAKAQAESPVVDRWNEYMKDVMTMELDPETGAQPKLKQVFLLD